MGDGFGVIFIPFVPLFSKFSIKVRHRGESTKNIFNTRKKSTKSETLWTPCWLKLCFPPCIPVVPKLPPHGFYYTHSSPRANAKAGILIPGEKLQGQGAGAKEGFPKSAVPARATSGLWKPQPLSQSPPQGGNCLPHPTPRHHLWRNCLPLCLSWSYPSSCCPILITGGNPKGRPRPWPTPH